MLDNNFGTVINAFLDDKSLQGAEVFFAKTRFHINMSLEGQFSILF